MTDTPTLYWFKKIYTSSSNNISYDGADYNINSLAYLDACILVYTLVLLYCYSRHIVLFSCQNMLEWGVLVFLSLWTRVTAHPVLVVMVTILGLAIHWLRRQHPYLSSQNKAIFVTGCDRGIGHELAKHLDKLGYHVYAGCLQIGGVGEQDLKSKCSRRLHTVQLDVTNPQDITQAAEYVTKTLGTNDLWGVVNNAGICYIGNIEIMSQADIHQLMSVNFMGPVNVCRAFLPLLRRSQGRLVNIASNAGMAPVAQMGIYCASKSALASLTEVLRYELQHSGIGVSTIIPSGYRTGIMAYNKEVTAERWWQEASDIVKEDYGRPSFTPKFKYPNHESMTSPDLTPIVEKIVHALSTTSPKKYYYSGFLARLLPSVYLYLPQPFCDLGMKCLADWFTFKPDFLKKDNNMNSRHLK